MDIKGRESLRQLKDKLQAINVGTETYTLVASASDGNTRAAVFEVEGGTFDKAWLKLEKKLAKFVALPNWLRVDLITEEKPLNYEELTRYFLSIKRNNYINRGFRIKGSRPHLFLKEELVGNAILKPDKNHKMGFNLPNLEIDERNYAGYVNRKYNILEPSLNYLKTSTFGLFKTQGFFIEHHQIIPLENYGNGNEVRLFGKESITSELPAIIKKGEDYLMRQLQGDGKFIYGYYPTYNQPIKGYNSVRHFSSLYALLEAVEFSGHSEKFADICTGLRWGLNKLGVHTNGYFLIKDNLSGEIEYKLGAQATAILAVAKYQSVTQDKRFEKLLQALVKSMSRLFIDDQGNTTHVFDQDLQVKEKFRIIYYDGEALFSLVRSYELLQQPGILVVGEKLINHFIDNRYERYHDHWLSYSVNELIKYKPKKEYFEFGLKNVLINLSFIEKRDTAYPTMLELLVAAVKMVDELGYQDFCMELFKSEEDYKEVKERIRQVMALRTYHEVTTGVMFPENGMYFKEPKVIEGGFYTRHDRFRMRIDDAEHFLSGLINSYEVSQKDRGLKLKEFKQFKGYFLHPEQVVAQSISNFEYQEQFLTKETLSHTAFLAVSQERRTEINNGRHVHWTNGNQQIMPHVKEIGLLVTETPIENQPTLIQFIVPNIWEFMYEVSDYLREQFTGPVIAITGSAGKSTTRLMVEHLIGEDKVVLSNRGNHNTRFAMPLYLSKLSQGPDILNLEVSLNALNFKGKGPMTPLIKPTISVVTSIGEAHLSTLHTTLNVAKHKKNIFKGLTSEGVAIINHDMGEEEFAILEAEAKAHTQQIKTYSLTNPQADMYVKKIQNDKYSSVIDIHYQDKDYQYRLNIGSDGLIQNSLAALLMMDSLGFEIEQVKDRFETFKSLPKILETHRLKLSNGDRVDIVDDTHNASLPSMSNAISIFKERKNAYKGNGILVLGQIADLGESAEQTHLKLIADIVNADPDMVIGYGENMLPVLAQLPKELQKKWCSNLKELLDRIESSLEDDSYVLLKGSVSHSDFYKASDLLLARLTS